MSLSLCGFKLLIDSKRGCETYIVREGYEGLVRGNIDTRTSGSNQGVTTPTRREHDGVEANLRFGYGSLLKDGEGDAAETPEGKSLKGQYIIRVGWDDVRGWMGEVSFPFTDKELEFISLLKGWYNHRNCPQPDL